MSQRLGDGTQQFCFSMEKNLNKGHVNASDTRNNENSRNRKDGTFHRKSVLMTLQSVSKRFSAAGTKIDVLDCLDFEVHEGESIAVVGASGSGKSTLLQIMGTLDRPDSGSVFFRNHDLLSMSTDTLARFRNRRLGFVFQFHHLLQGFTAIENVSIPCRIQNMPARACRAASQEILERVGLKRRLYHRAEDLSGGEQQRVALARALVLKPEILLADEPTGNLDSANSQSVHQLLVTLNQELKMAMMVVTHNRSLADLMEKKVTIEQGRLVNI